VDVETERRNQTGKYVEMDVSAPLASQSRKPIEIDDSLSAQQLIHPTMDHT